MTMDQCSSRSDTDDTIDINEAFKGVFVDCDFSILENLDLPVQVWDFTPGSDLNLPMHRYTVPETDPSHSATRR